MSYMFASSACLGCGRVFSYNPELVPSIRVRWKDGQAVADPAGEREPVCADCVARANPIRKAHGLPPITVPHGAYEPQEVF